MNRSPIVAAMLVPLLFAACDRARPSADTAYKAAQEAASKAETPQAKLEIAERFLADYPDSEHTAAEVRAVANLAGRQLDDPARADAVVARVADQVKDPALRRRVLRQRVWLLGKLGHADELAAVAAQMAGIKPLTFDENISVAEAATEASAWQPALGRIEAALAQATPEAYRAENEDRKLTDDEVRTAVDARLASAFGDKGWTLANLGRFDEAFAAFAEGERHDTKRYTGESESGLDGYKGRALVMAGRPAEALEVLAPEAIFGNDDKALATMRQAYVAVTGKESGFDDYLWSARLQLARAVDDFTLPDYEGNEHSFSGLRKGDVTLLAFWFPT